METVKTYPGNSESPESGWGPLGPVARCDGVEWIAYRKPQPKSDQWVYIKLVANGRAARKANYWLSWDGKRFATGGDFYKLLQHRPQLHDAITSFVKEF